jgi:hypothetical protein
MRTWPSGGLWRHPDFLRLWGAQTISQVGSQVSLPRENPNRLRAARRATFASRACVLSHSLHRRRLVPRVARSRTVHVTAISLIQALTPERMRGRMNASRRFVVWGTIPVGAVGASLSFLFLALSPLRTIHEMPESPPEIAGPASA